MNKLARLYGDKLLMTMDGLKQELNKILQFIEDKDDVVFVDYPLYHNVGDLLILIGTIDFFNNNSIRVKSHLSTNNTNINLLNRKITSKTSILCQGGGNFGDLYPVHQNLREQLIQSFPNNRIIILPQTAYFESEEELQKSKQIFNKHPNVVMFARDKKTHVLFQRFSDQAYLMPDMAHELYGTLPKSKSQEGILYFLRKDIEKIPLSPALQQQIKANDCFDWNDLINKKDRTALSVINKLITVNSKLKSNLVDELVFKLWHAHSIRLVSRMANKFTTYDKVVTSRLHGHIFACLLDLPSVVKDNSYGKNTAYYNLWTKELPLTSVWGQ